MLALEQVNELLLSCERRLGQRLPKVRSQLKSNEQHIGAVWELLVTEAVLEIGSVKHEPDKNKPDVELSFPNQRKIWIEAKYLYPRYWKQERQTDEVRTWINEEARNWGIHLPSLSTRFDGDSENNLGPIRTLPQQHEKNSFMRRDELRNFFRKIKKSPNISHQCAIEGYSVVVGYHPGVSDKYDGGLQQEAPKSVEDHAVYIALRNKARQFQIQEPLVVCIGSDQSPALSPICGPQTPTVEQAVNRAFSKNSSLSGAVIVSIENKPEFLQGFKRKAHTRIFFNPSPTCPLSEMERRTLKQLNFNKWEYIVALEKWKTPNESHRRELGGSLVWRPGPMSIKIEIPMHIVVNSLAGKTNILQAFQLHENHMAARPFVEGWSIISCKKIEGKFQEGEPPKLELELAPSELANMWPNLE